MDGIGFHPSIIYFCKRGDTDISIAVRAEELFNTSVEDVSKSAIAVIGRHYNEKEDSFPMLLEHFKCLGILEKGSMEKQLEGETVK